LQDPVDFSLLRGVQKPDQTLVNQYKHCHNLLAQLDLDIYPYKLPIAKLQPQASRLLTLLEMLRHNSATVIVLDSDKELLLSDLDIVSFLEKTFDLN
jgi:hypothetical protein